MAKRKILFVEDHLVVYEGISRMLARHYEVIGPVDDGDEVIDAVIEALPDLVILDLELPNRHGTDILPELRQRFPEMPVLVLTVETSPEIMEDVLRLGAQGFVPKGAGIGELRVAIEELLAGKIHRSPRIKRAPWARAVPRSDQVVAKFEPRRRTIFQLIGLGRTTEEIARHIGASRWTVYYHRTQIRKLLRIESDRGLDRTAMDWVARKRSPESEGAPDEGATEA